MQLLAKKEGKIFFAEEAEKGKDYFCSECSQQVRVRKGFFRQPHFYHYRKNSSCSQSGKSEIHLLLQSHLLSLLPQKEGEMEKPFLSISRIADVAWPIKNLVFEIQCSPIPVHELIKRTEDYRSIGYEAVWILHERVFNQKYLSPQERFLWECTYFFTNASIGSPILIYDQFKVFRNLKTVYKGPKISVSLNTFSRSPTDKSSLPAFLQNRTLCFSMDLIEQGLKNPSLFRYWKQLENKYASARKRRSVWDKWKSGYNLFMEKIQTPK
jgi:hypothetical protein